MIDTQLYENGEYLRRNPTWHSEHAAWKARHVLRMMDRHRLHPRTVCEVGCGTGAVLEEIQRTLDCELWGYDISPQAHALSLSRANARLHFVLGDIRREQHPMCELLLLLDVVEHVEDYLGFLRDMKGCGAFKILHVPLDLSVQSLLRRVPEKVRDSAGHLHYFTKTLILRALQDCGYEILDYFFTPVAVDHPSQSFASRAARFPRRVAFSLEPDYAALLLGGYSLMVLAE